MAQTAPRVTAAQALEHEYLIALHNVNDEPVAEPFDFRFERDEITEQQLREMIWEQLSSFHPEQGASMPASFAAK